MLRCPSCHAALSRRSVRRSSAARADGSAQISCSTCAAELKLRTPSVMTLVMPIALGDTAALGAGAAYAVSTDFEKIVPAVIIAAVISVAASGFALMRYLRGSTLVLATQDEPAVVAH